MSKENKIYIFIEKFFLKIKKPSSFQILKHNSYIYEYQNVNLKSNCKINYRHFYRINFIAILIMVMLNLFLTSCISEKNHIKTIYIYNGPGASSESLLQTHYTLTKFLNNKFNIKFLGPEKLKEGSWVKDAVLFIMPGGADLPYLKELNGAGNNIIKKYVKNGGSYLGICAGAYYASAYIEFDKKGLLEVQGPRELEFFENIAIGPIISTYDYKTCSGCRAANLKILNNPQYQNIKFYYNGGGYFKDAHIYPNVKILANYDLNGNFPAMILIKYGKGKVLLSGVHFEYDPNLLDKNDKYLKNIILDLNESNTKRENFINELFDLLTNI